MLRVNVERRSLADYSYKNPRSAKKSGKNRLLLSPGVNRELTLRCCNKQTWANRLGYADRLRRRICDGLGDSLGFL